MQPDCLGSPYECLTLALGRDEEGPVVATLVRRQAPVSTGRAVLWVHGWSDYFFQTHVADFFIRQGYDFYAIDLRKYGRSLRSHQTPTFCRSLTEYFAELDEAVRIIREQDRHETLVLAAHSTGGLTTALWAHQRRARRPVDAIFLNSPFFDLSLPGWVRGAAEVATAELGRRRPYATIRRPPYLTYGHSLHADFRGEWSYQLAWKPIGGFPIRYGWLAAIRAGQRRLQAGLAIDVPVLVGCASRSLRSTRWHDLAHRTDTVLNVADVIRWAPGLGRHVTVMRFEDAMHDLTLSAAPVREALFSELARWLTAYVGVAPAAPRPVTPVTPEAVAPLAAADPGEPAGPGQTTPTAAGAAPADPD